MREHPELWSLRLAFYRLLWYTICKKEESI